MLVILILQEKEQIRIESLRQKDEISQSAVASPEVSNLISQSAEVSLEVSNTIIQSALWSLPSIMVSQSAVASHWLIIPSLRKVRLQYLISKSAATSHWTYIYLFGMPAGFYNCFYNFKNLNT
jgi:hypothetical protein